VADLVERIGGGDRQAEADLVTRFGRGVALLLDRHTRDRAEAEDLYQETFCVALEKLRRGELRNPATLPAFLAGIARNLAIEHYRKAARRKTEPDSETLAAVEAAGSGQLDRLMSREYAALVRRTIRELRPERDREVLFRFYIAEEDKDEIAAAFSLTGVQLNRVLHRARQRYKALLAERLGAAALAAVLALGATICGFVPLQWMGAPKRGFW